MLDWSVAIRVVSIYNNDYIGALSAWFSNWLLQEEHIGALVAQEEIGITAATELDSHAVSPMVGKHAAILQVLNKTVQVVSGFTSEIGRPIRVQVVNAAVIW